MKKGDRVVYKKQSVHGSMVKVGSKGTIVFCVDNPYSRKALVEFDGYGKVIVPLSYVEKVEYV